MCILRYHIRVFHSPFLPFLSNTSEREYQKMDERYIFPQSELQTAVTFDVAHVCNSGSTLFSFDSVQSTERFISRAVTGNSIVPCDTCLCFITRKYSKDSYRLPFISNIVKRAASKESKNVLCTLYSIPFFAGIHQSPRAQGLRLSQQLEFEPRTP